ncbi:MAG: ABC transporter permease [Chitinophagales bacterium]|nr:ABC transporter permease [Chitinophagales bacterium]MDW8394246.1 ABC transporter permease [Chitinophagales bacterium]
MQVWLSLLSESLQLAVRELTVNRLRTLLSLLGIAIGIFCVIAILSAVDSMEKNLREGVGKLGDNVVYVNKFPWGLEEGQTEYPWWKYWNRPHATYEEMRQLQHLLTTASAVAISIWEDGFTVQHGSNTLRDVTVNGVSHDFQDIFEINLQEGRYFTAAESASGAAVAILGANVAAQLFNGPQSPLGATIDLLGSRVTVIGVFRKEGKNIVNISNDDLIMVPYFLLTRRIRVDGMSVEPSLIAEARNGVSIQELKDDLRNAMRAIRRLPPRREDNFALNQISIIGNQITSLFGLLQVVAVIIGGFALLVGGFGIANIMFVTVRERTNQIGIKKALGAKNAFILTEFLLEAVILCLLGGLIGLLLVLLVMQALSATVGFDLLLSLRNVLRGLLIAGGIGIVAGIVPALTAARMDPVAAIRFK